MHHGAGASQGISPAEIKDQTCTAICWSAGLSHDKDSTTGGRCSVGIGKIATLRHTPTCLYAGTETCILMYIQCIAR